MNFTVFYAWQSDHPEETHKNLIRDAAKEALKLIDRKASNQDSPRQPAFVGRLDHDIENVAGMPEIAGTIFKKIEGCGIFLADLTFVGATQKGKRLPNPNVVLELGYAARCIGWDRIICVVNEAHGRPEHSIFDIRHRQWPIAYNLEIINRQEIRNAKKHLSGEIQKAVLGMMDSEHSAVEDAIAVLAMPTIYVMKIHGTENGFHQHFPASADDTDDVYFGPQWQMHVADRLLELKLITHYYNIDDGYSAYTWTYLGILVLKRLNFRQ